MKAGGAWENADNNGLASASGLVVSTTSATFGGWTVGIGGEYAFAYWLSGFVEYDYYNFGTQSTTLVTTAAILPLPVNVKAYDNVFRVGLNLRWSSGPVVARY